MEYLKVKKLVSNAFLPTRAYSTSVGLDLYTPEDIIVPSHKIGFVANTGIAIQLIPDTYGRVAPRSGLSVKGIDVLAGVIDHQYRGDIGVVLYNHSDEDIAFNRGDKIAQLIIERVYTPAIKHVLELDDTERGDKGFGSSDRKVNTVSDSVSDREVNTVSGRYFYLFLTIALTCLSAVVFRFVILE
jgi:dUTP pyrophosphatase